MIGNGFDIAHDLPTSYEAFHEYLKKEYPDADCPEGFLPEYREGPDGEGYFKTNEEVGFIENVISAVEGEKWSDLEKTLGNLDYDEYFDDWTEEDEDDNPFHEVYRNEDIANSISMLIRNIPAYFTEWINTIDLKHVVGKFAFWSLINSGKCHFLTFNYTETLEKIYVCKDVCHIHGVVGAKLLLGHGNNTDYYDEYMTRHTGSEGTLSELYQSLKKDTDGALKHNHLFFDGLSEEIHEVYSYGFSFADVDLIYIREICRRIKTETVTWFLNDYNCALNSPEYWKLEKKLRKCGFKGTVLTFHV